MQTHRITKLCENSSSTTTTKSSTCSTDWEMAHTHRSQFPFNELCVFKYKWIKSSGSVLLHRLSVNTHSFNRTVERMPEFSSNDLSLLVVDTQRERAEIWGKESECIVFHWREPGFSRESGLPMNSKKKYMNLERVLINIWKYMWNSLTLPCTFIVQCLQWRLFIVQKSNSVLRF